MTFENEEYLPYARQRFFTVLATGGSTADTASTMIEPYVARFAFELNKVHLHLSSPHASIVDFMAYLSHRTNSYFNQGLISAAMLGLSDYLYHPGESAIIVFSGDCIHCSMVYSAANHYGLEISGWAITIPVAGW